MPRDNTELNEKLDIFFTDKTIGENARAMFAAYLIQQRKTSTSKESLDELWQQYKRSRFEVCYQNLILTKAKAQESEDYTYDSQGHKLTSVTLSLADYEKIYGDILACTEDSIFVVQSSNALQRRLKEKHIASKNGESASDTTILCNIDITDDQVAVKKFKEWLKQEPSSEQPIPSNITDWFESDKDRKLIAEHKKAYKKESKDARTRLKGMKYSLESILNQIHNFVSQDKYKSKYENEINLFQGVKESKDTYVRFALRKIILDCTYCDKDGHTRIKTDKFLKSIREDPYLAYVERRHERDKAYKDARNEVVDAFVSNDAFKRESGSLIALQEDMEMYIGLALHVLEKAFDQALKDNAQSLSELAKLKATWPAIKMAAVRDINEQVRVIFQRALYASSGNGDVDYVQLNKTLDLARKPLQNNCYKVLAKHCHKKIPEFDVLCKIPSVRKHINKHAFESTTASPHEYFASNSLGLNARIDGSKNTSHHKEDGEGKQAQRIIHYSDGSCMMRLPSIPDVKYTWFVYRGNLEKQIKDTQIKISEAADFMRAELGDYQGPIILNRETSMPGAFMDDFFKGRNHQEKRLEIEIKAIHLHNKDVLAGSDAFVFIQGVAVNQHTKKLGYSWAFPDKFDEATLMADMAMLANLHHQVKMGMLPESGKITKAYRDVIEQYKGFLLLDPTKIAAAVFSESEYGKNAINLLTTLKESLKTAPSDTSGDAPDPESKDLIDLKELANKALLQIFAHNLHFDPSYGMLVQALSTYAQAATMAGCKSANERFSAVEGRAILLRLLNLRDCALGDARSEMIEALNKVITEPLTGIEALKTTMDTNYDKHAVYIRAAAAVSGLDQGAPAKLASYLAAKFKNIKHNSNTNTAEEVVVTRLFSKKASKMQAHKGDHAEDLLAAIDEHVPSRASEQVESSTFQLLIEFLEKEIKKQKPLVAFISKDAAKRVESLTELIEEMKNPYVSFEVESLKKRINVILDDAGKARLDTFITDKTVSESMDKTDHLSDVSDDSGNVSPQEDSYQEIETNEDVVDLSGRQPSGSVDKGLCSVTSERALFTRNAKSLDIRLLEKSQHLQSAPTN